MRRIWPGGCFTLLCVVFILAAFLSFVRCYLSGQCL